MVFAHDSEVALAEATALVNTFRDGREYLPDVASLDEFVRTWNWSGVRRRDTAELREVQALRPRLRRLWEATEDEAVEIVNTLLREGDALPQLVRHDQWDYHLHATPPHAPLATRMAVDAAMAFVDVIRQKELGRVRICAYEGCDNVLIDLSKNRSRRFCEYGCGNRGNVAAYRERKARQAAAG